MDHQKMMDLRSNLMPGYHNQIVTLVKFANLFVKCCLQMEGSWANDKVFLCFSCGLWAWDVRSIGDLPDGKPNRVPLVWFLIHRFYKRKSIFTRRINIHFQLLDCLKSIITTQDAISIPSDGTKSTNIHKYLATRQHFYHYECYECFHYST